MAAGLRERKKQETRQRISDAASQLFLARGFDEVTVAQVAEAADVSRVTVTNYFPRKEDLILDLYDEAEALLLDALRDRPAGQPAAGAMRGLMRRLVAQRHPLTGTHPDVAVFGRLVAASPALRDRAREQQDELAAAVAALLAEETGDPAGAELAGGLLLATIRILVVTPIRRLMTGEPAETVVTDLDRQIDRAFDLLADGLRGFAPH